MPMDSISMLPNTLYVSNVDVGSSLRAFVAFRISRLMSVVQAEKSGIVSTSIGNGKKLTGYASVVKKE